MTQLAAQRCEPCSGATPRLTADEIEALRPEIAPEWTVAGGRRLLRRYGFKDFASAYAFTGLVAELAEQQGHHPDLRLGWGYVEIELTTHAIGGLSHNDFVLAAKIDQIRS